LGRGFFVGRVFLLFCGEDVMDREKELSKLKKADLIALVVNQDRELVDLRRASSLVAGSRVFHGSHGVELLVRGGEDDPLSVTQALGAFCEKFLELFPQNVKALRKYLVKMEKLERDQEKSEEDRVREANEALRESGVDPVVAPGFDSLLPDEGSGEEDPDLVEREVKVVRKGKFLRVKRQ